MVMTMEPQIEMGTPVTMAIGQLRMEDLVGMETPPPQIGEEEDLLEAMEIQMEEMEVLTLMTVGMEMIFHPQQILLLLEGEGIENPNMFMYYKGHPGQEGQAGQAGRDGRDGQALPLVRALEETLRAQITNLDTTGLENSFSQFGRTMSEVLRAQQRTNQNLEEQFRRANETQEFQTEAMQDIAQANF